MSDEGGSGASHSLKDLELRMLRNLSVRTVVAAIAVVVLASCAVGGDEGTQFAENGIALEVPSGWSVTGFSVDVTPRRLVAASYNVNPADVEGDCGGQAAIQRLPRDGAYVVLIDYGPFPGNVDRDDFNADSPVWGRQEPFRDKRFAEFACFGPSYVFFFVARGRALQAHLGIGPDTTPERRDEAVEVLNSITAEPE
jgi:hypothetical protein